MLDDETKALIDAHIESRNAATPAAPTAAPAATAAPEAAVPKTPEEFGAAVIAAYERGRAAAQPAAATGTGPAHVQAAKPATYQDPGAPNGNPDTARGSDLMSWSRDDVERAKRDGTFRSVLDEYRNSLPGGNAGGLFRKRNRALGR